jgi:hypothetical protein
MHCESTSPVGSSRRTRCTDHERDAKHEEARGRNVETSPVIVTTFTARLIGVCAIVGFIVGALVPHAWAQETRTGALRQQTTESEEEEPQRRPSALVRLPALGPTLAPTYPGLSNYPLELLGLLMSPLERRDVNLLPTLAISEEFNDNIFLNNDRKRYDFITSFTPGIMALVNRPRFQLAAGFSNDAQLYARGSSPNDGFARQNFVIGSIWEPTPVLTLAVADTFLRDQSPDATAGGFALGGQQGLSNILNPTMGWQVGPETRLDLGAIYSVLRFEGQGAGIDSDTYGFTSNLSHAFTPRFIGMAGYNFTYLDLRSGHGANATTHNPTLGFTFRVTPTLSINVDGGPAFTHLGDEDFITPALSAGFSQRLSFGNLSGYYARSVGVAGGFGGPTDNQTVSGTLLLPLWRDLIVIFNPAWTNAESLSDQQIQRVDVSVLTLSLGAAYRVNPYITLFGGYSFLLQRVGHFSTTQDFDADQNRVKFGVQFGYPFAFDLGG